MLISNLMSSLHCCFVPKSKREKMVTLDQVDWQYISYEELDMMLRLIQSETNVELRNDLTPLCNACKFNREDLVTVLLQHGAKANKPCYSSKQPLHFACEHSTGNLGVVRKLIQANADIDALDQDGNTGLHFACSESNVIVTELLIESGADVNLADVDGETPLVRACFAESTELLDILLKRGSDPNVCKGLPMEIAVMKGSVQSLKLLMKGGANVNLGKHFMLACEHNHLEIMKILKDHGSDVNRTNVLGITPLQTACLSRSTDPATVNLLLEWGAKVNALSNFGATALSNAVINQNLGKIKLLLAYGADVNTGFAHLLSSLLMGTKIKNTKGIFIRVFRLLLAAGIRLELVNLDCLKVASISFLRNDSDRNEMVSLLNIHATQPLSLQSLCRIRIRSCVKSNVNVNVRTLPLPLNVILFLNFQDIVKDSVDC